MKILLACSAGMSTSLLVTNMKKVADPADVIEAHPVRTVPDIIDNWDVLLLGPQVRYLEKEYKPHLDYGEDRFFGQGGFWQKQLHIYDYPLYYIDYCLAQTVALQFFAAWLKDTDDAWKRYLALVEKGGTKTYAGLVESAGFAVPFENGSLAPVAKDVANWIASHPLNQ